MTTRNPYDVLGVPHGSSFSTVRAQYFRLARQHHPDKLSHVTEEERQKHEEIFKEISAAYDTLERRQAGGEAVGAEERDWRKVWSKVESLFQQPEVWDCVQRVFKDTVVDAMAQRAEQKKKERLIHTVYMDVTLGEMHSRKVKKVQLFLQGINEPVVTRVCCADYPDARIQAVLEDGETHTIHVHMNLKEHAIYRFDDLLGKWDLYTQVSITWVEYLTGKEVTLPSLDNREGGIVAHVPVCPRMDVPLVVEGAGVAGKGDLYISLQWSLPSRECWEQLSANDKNDFMRILNALSA